MSLRYRALSLVLPAILVLGGCVALTSEPPPALTRLGLRLPPNALGQPVSVQQHLRVERHGRIDDLEAALEIDAQKLTLVGLAFGQRVLSLHYDGQELQSWRHPMLPAQVRAEDVLEDLQLTLWPAQAIRAALPPGWTIEEHGLRRTLFAGDSPVTVIDYSDETRWHGKVELSNLRYGYRLTIQSVSTVPQDAIPE